MTLANQDAGTTAASPLVRGDTIALRFNVTSLVQAEVASAIYRVLSHAPEIPGANLLLTKQTGGSGVTFADNADPGPPTSVDFDVAIDPADTSALFADDYYHELRVTKSNGLTTVSSKGTLRLSAGAPALV